MLDLRDLECLTALARHRHFARAAEECGVSQPAFSIRIRNLEDRLNATIVKRGNRFQGWTAEGEAIVEHARTIIDQVRALEQEVLAARGEITGSLTLGAIPTAAAYAADLAIRIRTAHPGIVVRTVTDNSFAVQHGVDDGHFDAGLTYTEGASVDLLRVEPIYEEGYVLLVPEAMAPRPSGTASWSEAAGLDLVLLEPEMQNRRILDRIFEDIGDMPNVVADSNGLTAGAVMAVQGAAATIVPQVFVDAMGPFSGTVALPLVSPEIEKSISLVTHPRAQPIPIVEALRRVAGLPG